MTFTKSIIVLFIFVFLCYAENTIIINATIYDHSPSRNPDFETTISDDRGLVSSTLGPDRKPKYAHQNDATTTVHNSTTFASWFRDTPGINLPIGYSIKLKKGKNSNIYTYSNSDFFPIDGKGFGNEDRSHNYHFCLEMHSSFTYQGGETFQFTGDDDVFVFIDNRLAIDLGGIHSAESKSISLDSFGGLTSQQNYKLDFFFCERHTTRSNLKVQTTLKLFCDYTDRCGVCEGSGESCPCNCDDGNDCTTDSCDSVSGVCIYTGPKDCGSNVKSGWANTGAIVGVVVGGTAFVGLSVVGGKKAVDKYNARKQGQPPANANNSNLFYKWALKNKFPQPKPATSV